MLDTIVASNSHQKKGKDEEVQGSDLQCHVSTTGAKPLLAQVKEKAIIFSLDHF